MNTHQIQELLIVAGHFDDWTNDSMYNRENRMHKASMFDVDECLRDGDHAWLQPNLHSFGDAEMPRKFETCDWSFMAMLDSTNSLARRASVGSLFSDNRFRLHAP